MLALTRKVGQWIRLGKDIRVQFVKSRGLDTIVLGIEAPYSIRVIREEALPGKTAKPPAAPRSAGP